MLENDDDSVTVLDFSAEDFNKQKILKELKKTDIVGITILSYSLNISTEIIRYVKKNKPDVKVIIGGPHCTLFPQKTLKDTQADICVEGDGEFTIANVKQAIKNENSFSMIPGIYYREGDKIRRGKPLKLINNLDSIPFPARHLVKKYVYGREYNPKIKRGEFTSVITSRGCPFKCTFCSRNLITMKRYRTRSVVNILEELQELEEKGYKYVAFEDDSFLVNKKQAHALFDGIIENNIDMRFIITAARVDSAEEKLFHKMKKAGVTHIQFGLESGNQDVLDFYNKKTTTADIKHAVNLSHSMGFFTIGTFILGASFENLKHFEKTVKFAKSLPLDSVSFLPLRYVAGSPLWYKAVQHGKILEDEYMVYSDSRRGLGLFTYEEIKSKCMEGHRSFYLRPRFMIRLLMKSLRNNDFGFLQSYLSIFFSDVKKSLSFIGV